MHTVFALLCFVVVIHRLIFPYPSGLPHWHCGNLKIAPVPAKQPWWIWINTSCEFIMNDCITTTKQSTTKPGAYFLGYTVWACQDRIKRHPHAHSQSQTIPLMPTRNPIQTLTMPTRTLLSNNHPTQASWWSKVLTPRWSCRTRIPTSRTEQSEGSPVRV